MKYLTLFLFLLFGETKIIAQNVPFDLKSFVSTSYDAWTSSLGNKQTTHIRCMELCRGTGFHKRPAPTLPPYFYRVDWSFKTTVNCSNEIRGLRPMCNALLRLPDLIQFGGNQYTFPLEMSLKYHEAQKYCRSRKLELASLRIPKLDSHLLATYFKSYANMSAENKAIMSGKVTFWELKTDVTNKSNVMQCPSFSLNLTDFVVINASRVQEPCSNVNMFVCEVPNICYKDVCRLNFISKYKVVPPPSPAPTAGTTVKSAASTTTTTSPVPFICEQCHLNHTVLYASGCPGIACPTCWGIEKPDVVGKDMDLGECNGKSYAFLNVKMTHAQGMAKCCALGMRSVSITTDDDSECIKDYLNSLSNRNRADEGQLMWTSGTDAGSNCQGRFTWCTDGVNGAVNALTRLIYNQNNQLDTDDCLTMNVKTVLTDMNLNLTAKPCSTLLPVLCEGPPSPNSKYKNSTVLSKRGGTCEGKVGTCPRETPPKKYSTVYANENSRFFDGPKKNAFICDKIYDVVQGSVSKFEALSLSCVDRRLTVGFVESFEELNCVRDRYLATATNPSSLDLYTPVAWLKASDQNCPSATDGPAWCQNGATMSSRLMKTGSAGSRCVGIDMKSSRFNVVSISCEKFQEYYLCKETCSFPTCPKVSCEITTSGDAIGTKSCGGMYLAVKERKKMTDAMEHCCQLGMSLLSMETAAETDCIAKWVREKFSDYGPLWTSGTDNGCKGKYAWCSTGEMFPRESFHRFYFPPTSSGEDDSDPDHNCVSAVFKPDLPLKHDNCDAKFSFICEKVNKVGRREMWPQSPSLRKN